MGKIRTKRAKIHARAAALAKSPKVAEAEAQAEEVDVWAPASLKLGAGAPSSIADGFDELFAAPTRIVLSASSATGPVGDGAATDAYTVRSMEVEAQTSLAPLDLAMAGGAGAATAVEDRANHKAAANPAPITTLGEQAFTVPQMSKLERRKLKKEQFLKKLHGAYSSRKKHSDIAKKKANPPALVGDITGLQGELEAIGKAAAKSPAVKSTREQQMTSSLTATAAKVTRRTSTKKGRAHTLEIEAANFKSVLSHPQFKINAGATVKEHLKNSLASDKQILEVLKGLRDHKKEGSGGLSKGMKKTKRGKGKTADPKNLAKGTKLTMSKFKVGKIGKGGRLTKSSKNPNTRKKVQAGRSR